MDSEKKNKKKQIAILGSTGSIGTQALQVIEEHPDLYEAYALTANNRVELLIAQARKFQPEVVVIANEEKYAQLKEALSDLPIKVYAGIDAVCQIVDNALRVDSLQELLNRQNLYIMNIQDIFSGKVPIDSVQTLDSLTAAREDTLMERTRREEEFRRQYEENEKYNLTTIVSQPDVNGLILYRPTRGMVSDHFNTDKKHFGTDIAANPNESVLATMDGTVFLSTYTAETGYVIGVQHSQDFVSIYKHCGSLLKKEGDRVKGGEAIALVGNSGTLSTGPHLHFELWYKGHPVNPEKYIVI